MAEYILGAFLIQMCRLLMEREMEGFTTELDAESRQRARHATQQQMVISYTMGGDKDLINAECRASLDTMKQEIRTEIKAQ